MNLRSSLILVALATSNVALTQLSPCSGGTAAGYPCDNYDLVGHLSISELDGDFEGNDIWGWTNPETGVEFALMGLDNGTAFVSLCDPENPQLIGHLATHTGNSLWRDIKVYQNHAYIVSEAGGHGMQVFDLMQLPTSTTSPIVFEETTHYDQFGSAHNIVINEETGFAYPVGTSDLSGGPLFIDLQDPADPTSVGGYGEDGYTHDAQVVIYNGPDTEHVGKEVCFASNTNTLTLIDFTDKSDPEQLSRTGYDDVNYTHQGWLTEDHRYFLMNDEQDELFGQQDFTRTIIWDCLDLDNPVVIGEYLASNGSIDHNLYIKDNIAYLANYNSGLRVLDLSNIAAADLNEIGYFDVHPQDDNVGFNGSWSVYPFFESGLIIISSIEQGLFIVKASASALPEVNCPPSSVAEETDLQFSVFPNPVEDQFQINLIEPVHFEVMLLDALGRIVHKEESGSLSVLTINVESLATGTYNLIINTERSAGHKLLIVD